MPGTPTPILGLILPTVGGDANTWGGYLVADLVILDNLGALAVLNVSTSQAIPNAIAAETVVRVATGALRLSLTLPPAVMVTGKVFTLKKIDAGVGVAAILANMDGQTEYDLTNQYAYVRLVSNGASYDVVGQGG